MALSKRDYFLLGISLLLAVGHFYGLQFGLFPAKPFIKGPVILLLALVAFLNTEGKTRILLTIALALSSIGDIFLALPPTYFIHGLVSFLLAHLFYIALFLGIRRPRLTPRDGFIAVGLTAYGLTLVSWLYPTLGPMAAPVIVYAAVLLVMGFTASLCDIPRPTVFIGALVFIASDSGIAITKFAGAGVWLSYFTWTAYVLAQYLIVLGLIFRQDKT